MMQKPQSQMSNKNNVIDWSKEFWSQVNQHFTKPKEKKTLVEYILEENQRIDEINKAEEKEE